MSCEGRGGRDRAVRERARESGGNDGRLVRIVVAGRGPTSFRCKGPRSIAVLTGVTMARASGTGK